MVILRGRQMTKGVCLLLQRSKIELVNRRYREPGKADGMAAPALNFFVFFFTEVHFASSTYIISGRFSGYTHVTITQIKTRDIF